MVCHAADVKFEKTSSDLNEAVELRKQQAASDVSAQELTSELRESGRRWST